MAQPPMYPPAQPQPQTENSGAVFWLAVFTFVINLAIAIQLVFGLISVSYLRSQAEAQSLAPASTTTPPPTTSTQPPVEPSISERVLADLSGVVSRGLATLVLFFIVFAIALVALRFVPNGRGQVLAQWMGWGYIFLASVLWLAALWRFGYVGLGFAEYGAYLGIGVLMVLCAVVLALAVRQSRMCRRFAIPLAVIACLQVLLILFRAGLRLDVQFGLSVFFFFVIVVVVLVLLYASAIIGALGDSH
jgi:hypothetical protein